MGAVGVGRALATVVALALACGASSVQAYTVKHTETGATVRWHAPAVSLRIDPSMERYFADIPVAEVMRDSAEAWAGLPGVPELLISDGTPGPQGFERNRASNGVYLVEDWKLAESSLAVTVATYETRTGKIIDTDILVNANHPFALLAGGPDRASEQFDLRGVMTHEVGHVLGLGESSDARWATMWPTVARGETHQRDLDEDDMQGAQTAYAQALAVETTTAAAQEGCGPASVVVSRTRAPSPLVWLGLGLGLVAVGVWLRARTKKGRGKGGPLFALVLLFGAPFGTQVKPLNDSAEKVQVLRTLALRRTPPDTRREYLAEAVQSAKPEVRMAAAAVLERVGVREDATLATELALDENPEVRRIGLLASERVRTAPPAARLRADSPEARARLQALVGDATEVVEGEAVRAGVSNEDGLLWSRYLVHGQSRVVEVQIAGGTLGELTQVVSEQEAPPDGAQVVVATRPGRRNAWAHLRDGVVYGGFLGDGPAIEWKRAAR